MKLPRALPVIVSTAALTLAASSAFAQREPSFGTSSRIQYHMGYGEFMPDTNSSEWGQKMTFLGRSNPSQFDQLLMTAHPHLPSGAKLISFELDACGVPGPIPAIFITLLDCDFLGSNCNTLGVLPASDTCGFQTQSLVSQNYTMENNSRQLIVRANILGGAPNAAVLGAYIGYELQVSPAPAVASFSDVPTTSPLFKFVEALAASGITAGCGGGNFCPNQPLTRGQMAVFLSVALGLHFPD